MKRRIIGGVFPLELPHGDGGMIQYWGVPSNPYFSFRTARSSFAALVDLLKPRTVWVPAYICQVVPGVIQEDLVRYYPVGAGLSPDADWLDHFVRAGDLLLGVDYFGCPPDSTFLSFVHGRTDVTFVEDCAHAIDTGVGPWGTWRLYSPRKVFGVPDGGILVPSDSGSTYPHAEYPPFDAELFTPVLHRFEDIDGMYWTSWHEAHVRQMEEMGQSHSRMSHLTRSVLNLIDPAEVIRRRKVNFSILDTRLSDISFLPPGGGALPLHTPFGFPIRLPSKVRNEFRSALFQQGIYAARHWEPLPSPNSEFCEEHQLSGELLTLPCDQRYDADDMNFLADTTLSVLRDCQGSAYQSS